MYYHSTSLKYVTYGKIFPYEDDDNWLNPTYQWLGHHCGYSPQIWLSRSHSQLTGFRSSNTMKGRKNRSARRINKDSVLFGFDNIQGFDVDYGQWCDVIHHIIRMDDMEGVTHSQMNEFIIEGMDRFVGYHREDPENMGPLEDYLKWWSENKDLEAFLKKYLFVQNDQVVVPSLNLKSAKKIICHNEKQKKALRKMGFIEDRIQIKNVTRNRW